MLRYRGKPRTSRVRLLAGCLENGHGGLWPQKCKKRAKWTSTSGFASCAENGISLKYRHRSSNMLFLQSLLALLVCFQSVVAFAPCRVQRIPTSLKAATTEWPEGLIKTVAKQGTGPPLTLGDVASVKYRCYLSDDESKAPFAKSDFQKVVRRFVSLYVCPCKRQLQSHAFFSDCSRLVTDP